MAHVVIKLLAVFTAVRIGNNISAARIAFDSTHEWHGEEQKNRASVKDHHRPFWPSKVEADGFLACFEPSLSDCTQVARHLGSSGNRRRCPRRKLRVGQDKQVESSQVKSSQVKSNQVKSSQVKFKMAVAIPPPLVPIAGASDREGRSRRNRHLWIAPSRGIIPIFLFLMSRIPPVSFYR